MAMVWLAVRHDLQQAIGGRRDFPDGRIECLLVSLGGFAVAAHLAHKLERRRCYLLSGGRCGFAPENFDASTHGGLPKILAQT